LAVTITAKTKKKQAKILLPFVVGDTSPYPTVVPVTNPQYIALTKVIVYV
jgi:hypothetical protein